MTHLKHYAKHLPMCSALSIGDGRPILTGILVSDTAGHSGEAS
jgi:hypothetical protein